MPPAHLVMWPVLTNERPQKEFSHVWFEDSHFDFLIQFCRNSRFWVPSKLDFLALLYFIKIFFLQSFFFIAFSLFDFWPVTIWVLVEQFCKNLIFESWWNYFWVLSQNLSFVILGASWVCQNWIVFKKIALILKNFNSLASRRPRELISRANMCTIQFPIHW